MRVITKGNENVSKLWGKQSPKDCSYRQMRYLLAEPCGEETLLLNTVTGEMLALTAEEASTLEALPACYERKMDDLIAHHVLVPYNFDEAKTVDQLREVMRAVNRRREITGYSILPTTGCNARCFYCYESGYPHHTMTQEVADKTVEFINENCGERRKVSINWFGGEPTLGERCIDRICDGLVEKGIDYSSTMISNGYLFSTEMVAKAREKWKLKSVQITLDGTEEIYNRAKAYVYDEPSPYRRVMRNIGLLLDAGIKVSVRMNLDFHNAEDLRVLIDILGKEFANKDGFTAYVHDLFEEQGFEPVHHTEKERGMLAEEAEKLGNLIERVGVSRAGAFKKDESLPSIKVPYCMADNMSSVQVNPLGQLGKCEHYVYDRLVGSIEGGLDYTSENAKQWIKPCYLDSCKACAIYPHCGRPSTCEAENLCSVQAVDIKLERIRKQMRSVSQMREEAKA